MGEEVQSARPSVKGDFCAWTAFGAPGGGGTFP
jgi:hypothetical protein